MSTSVLDYAPTLDRDEKADFVVVGSGIAGLSVAYELSKAGQDVVVVDRGPVGKGMTSRTTAYLTAQCDDGFEQLVSRRGEEIARLWYQSQAAYRPHPGQPGGAWRRQRVPPPRWVSLPRTGDRRWYYRQGIRGHQKNRNAGRPSEGRPVQRTSCHSRAALPETGTFHPLKYLADLAKPIRVAGAFMRKRLRPTSRRMRTALKCGPGSIA